MLSINFMVRGRGLFIFNSYWIEAGLADKFITRSERNAASDILWVTNKTVALVNFQIRSSSKFKFSLVFASKAQNGSSISNIEG